jgi:hypothetical protein
MRGLEPLTPYMRITKCHTLRSMIGYGITLPTLEPSYSVNHIFPSGPRVI